MEALLALMAGVLYGTGVYLMLRRRLAQLIIGIGLLSHGSNLLILTAAGVTRGRPPLAAAGDVVASSAAFADPVPQSLILTSIVIGFGVLAFALVLAHRVHLWAGTDDVDEIVQGQP